MNINYNKALEMLERKEIGRSPRLGQLLTFHTITMAKIMYKSAKAESHQRIIDNFILKEIEDIKNGITNNPEWDGGKVHNYDFFIKEIVGDAIDEAPKKPEWGEEIMEVNTVVPAKVKQDNQGTFSAVSILKYANGTQITKMLNSAGSDLVRLKPYDNLTIEECRDVLFAVKTKATAEKKKLIDKFANEWGF